MRKNYEVFMGEERLRLSRKGSAEALGMKKGRSVPPEWPSFVLLAHQIAAFFSFFFSDRLRASCITQPECTEA